jgi:hypothetical protein
MVELMSSFVKKAGTIICLLGMMTLFISCFDFLKIKDDKNIAEETGKIPKGEYHFVNETQYKITINIYTPFRENGSVSQKTGNIEFPATSFSDWSNNNFIKKIIHSDYEKLEFDWTVEYKQSSSPNGIHEERVIPIMDGSKLTFMYYTNAKQSVSSSNSFIERYKYNEEYWGEWISSVGAKMYINGMDIFYEWRTGEYSGSVSNDPFMKRISTNVLKYTDTYYFASRIPNGSFNGRVVSDIALKPISGAKAISGLGGIDVVVSNLNNSSNNQKTKTDNNGNFEVEGVIPGDIYIVAVDDKSVPVKSNTPNEDIGNVMIKDGINFKASIDAYTIWNEGWKHPEHINGLISNEDYYTEINISIINASAYNGLCQYQLALPGGLISASSLSGTFYSNEKGIKIPIELNCINLNNEYEYKKITIQITAGGMIWDDSVSLKFYREKKRIYFYSEPLDGFEIVVRTPHFETYTGNYYLGEYPHYARIVDIPKSSGEDYVVVIISHDEVVYNIAIDQNISPNYDNLQTDKEYDSENNPKIFLPNDIVRSYLYEDETVFYKFRF